MKKVKAMKVEIDRLEGDIAVIVMSDDDLIKFNLPVKCLPEGVGAGDHLLMSFSVDEKSRDEVKSKVEDLLRELTKSDE